MRGLRPSVATGLARRALVLTKPTTTTTTTTTIAVRSFSASTAKKSGGAPQFDPPTGWLFGVKPGEKYQKEGWEDLWYWGYYGGLVVFIIAYAFKPDTSIQTWALEEARRRLEAEGILEDPENENKK